MLPCRTIRTKYSGMHNLYLKPNRLTAMVFRQDANDFTQSSFFAVAVKLFERLGTSLQGSPFREVGACPPGGDASSNETLLTEVVASQYVCDGHAHTHSLFAQNLQTCSNDREFKHQIPLMLTCACVHKKNSIHLLMLRGKVHELSSLKKECSKKNS